jgi:thioredoxin-related protein
MQKMSLTRASAAMLLLICLSSGALRAAPPEGYNFLPLSDAARQASAENKPMLLYFGRYGCTTCRKMHAEVFSDAAVSKKYNGEFVLAYVDTESGNRIRLANGETTTEMQFAARSRILGTPTFIYFSPEQKPLFKKAGFQSIEQMKRYVDFVARGHYRTMSLQDYLASL